MNFKKIFGGLGVVLLIVSTAFGQQLKIRRIGNVARVMQGKKFLYQVVLRGKPNEKRRKHDEAFAAGQCLIVRRDVQETEPDTESYPDVSRLEIYQANGKRRIYRESQLLAISRISDWDLMNSPDSRWAIIPDNGEAMFSGYFQISPQCEIRQVNFDSKDDFVWGDREDGQFIDAATLKFSSIINRLPNSQTKKVNIFITKDGKFRVEDMSEQ